MINNKGEWIYTNSEIAYELGMSPATVNSIGKKMYGIKVPHWTINEVKMILEYMKSISIEEDSKRLNLLRETVAEAGFEPFEEAELKRRIDKDICDKKYERGRESELEQKFDQLNERISQLEQEDDLK